MKKFSDNQIKDILDELYVICRQTGRSCDNCPFKWDETLRYEFGYENGQSVEMCPLDVALLEWKSSMGRGNQIHPWVRKNIDTIYERLLEFRKSS